MSILFKWKNWLTIWKTSKIKVLKIYSILSLLYKDFIIEVFTLRHPGWFPSGFNKGIKIFPVLILHHRKTALIYHGVIYTNWVSLWIVSYSSNKNCYINRTFSSLKQDKNNLILVQWSWKIKKKTKKEKIKIMKRKK